MLNDFTGADKVYIACGYTDLRRGIDGLAAMVQQEFSLDHINLAELERRSGVSHGKLRRLKRNGFRDLPRSTKGRKHTATKLSGYTGLLDSLLHQGELL